MYRKISSYFSLILIIVSTIFFACNKRSDIGFSLIPEKYVLDPNAQDTFKVAAYTYKVDSLATRGTYKGLLGTYIDPIFGELNASFITEMRPSATLSKGTSPEFDSIVMYLKYDTVTVAYGNRFTESEINVYKINERLYYDSIYYNNLNPNDLNPELLATSHYSPSQIINNKLIVWEDTLDKVLAVKLDFNFGKKLFEEDSIWTDTTFATYFNGFLIKPNATIIDGAISIFDLTSADSKVALYYHNSTDDSLSFSFNFATYSTRVNLFEHNFNAPGFLADIENPESRQDSVVYIQGAAGLKAKIEFPDLDKLKNDGLFAVNRAELYVNVESESVSLESLYPVPSRMILIAVSEDGTYDYLAEYLTDTGYLGVPYENNQYVFDITYIIQKIVKGEVANNGFMLMLSDGGSNPSRVVVTSGDNSNRMKLVLTLTKLE